MIIGDLIYSDDGKKLLECLDKYKTHYDIRNGTEVIHDSVFENCDNLRTITIPDSVKEIRQSAFRGCDNLLSVTIPQKVTMIGRSAFSGCSSLKSVTIESYFIIMDYDAFKGCASLSSIVSSEIKGSLTNNCQGIEMTDSVTIPNCVNRIHSYAFHDCTGLTTVILSDNITEIERGAFRGCARLRLLVIGVGLTMVEDMAFMDCTNLNEIRINAVDPPKCDADVFSGVSLENIRLLVPRGSRDAYSKADVWKNFKDNIFDTLHPFGGNVLK